MGPEAFLARLRVEVRRHNLIGDTTWCRGTVTDVRRVDERGEVTIRVEGVNQRDETIAVGEAVVRF
jgi:acyl dehydratase